MLKNTLRQHLEQVYQDKDLSCWFDPLHVHAAEDGKTVKISFPHALFGQWFMNSVRSSFETQILPLVHPMSLVYDCPGVVTPPSRDQGNGLQDNAGPFSFFDDTEKSPISEEFHGLSRPPERHTFDSFLVNRKNDFPLAAARDAAACPDKPTYNPFVLYGQSGSGKSHLLGAMANAVIRERPDIPVYYGDLDILGFAESEASLARCFIIIDNAQRICAYPHFQERMTLILDRLCLNNTPMVFAFDQHPGQCAGMQKKLVSRLCGGLLLELKKPDIDIRRQYIHKKSETEGIQMDKEQELVLAQRYHDFRAIDGILARLSAYRSAVDNTADLRNILEKDEEQKYLTPNTIIALTARYFSVSPEEITGKNRNRAVVLPRQAAIYLVRELLGIPLIQMGKIFGNRDHSSIVYAIKKIKESEKSNKVTNNILKELKQLCLAVRN